MSSMTKSALWKTCVVWHLWYPWFSDYKLLSFCRCWSLLWSHSIYAASSLLKTPNRQSAFCNLHHTTFSVVVEAAICSDMAAYIGQSWMWANVSITQIMYATTYCHHHHRRPKLMTLSTFSLRVEVFSTRGVKNARHRAIKHEVLGNTKAAAKCFTVIEK